MLEIGLGFFAEVSLDEAKPIIIQRKKLFEEKVEKVSAEIIKIRANITRVNTITFSLYNNFISLKAHWVIS